jgi:ribosomal protein L12E/L44/L45/RPP1/RPP2
MMEAWRTESSAREDPTIMKKLGVALLAVAFALPTFVVAQEQKEEKKTTEKKKKSKKKKEEKKKEEKPAR